MVQKWCSAVNGNGIIEVVPHSDKSNTHVDSDLYSDWKVDNSCGNIMIQEHCLWPVKISLIHAVIV